MANEDAAQPWYGCVEDAPFLAEAIQTFGGIGKWDDVKELVERDIVRAPHAFDPIPGHPNWYFAQTTTKPRWLIIFRVDDSEQKVHYKGVRRTGSG